jgi:glycosyltransferase involved in cell wall biosynthesis
MKNIAIVIDSLAGGGAEKVMIVLANELVSMGHRVCIFALKPVKEYSVPNGVELVFPFQTYKGAIRGWFNTASLARMLQDAVGEQEGRHGNFDLSLLNLYESYRIGGAANLRNSYCVMHNAYVQELKRERLMGPIKYWYMRRILRSLNGKQLIGVSKGVSEELIQSSLFKAKSVVHIYNPFDIDAIHAQASLSVDMKPDQKFVLHVGRAAKAKRHDVLFKAFKDVDPEYKLVCLSRNVKKLSKLASKYGISDRLILPGFSDNPYAWMQKSELVVLSSDFEGLSLVLIEALICGTRVVSTNCPHGPSEILTGDHAQFLVKVGDSIALAEAINKALTYNVQQDDSQLIEQFGVKNVVQKYLTLIPG